MPYLITVTFKLDLFSDSIVWNGIIIVTDNLVVLQSLDVLYSFISKRGESWSTQRRTLEAHGKINIIWQLNSHEIRHQTWFKW